MGRTDVLGPYSASLHVSAWVLLMLLLAFYWLLEVKKYQRLVLPTCRVGDEFYFHLFLFLSPTRGN